VLSKHFCSSNAKIREEKGRTGKEPFSCSAVKLGRLLAVSGFCGFGGRTETKNNGAHCSRWRVSSCSPTQLHAGRVPGSVNIPLDDSLPATFQDRFEPDTPLLVVNVFVAVPLLVCNAFGRECLSLRPSNCSVTLCTRRDAGLAHVLAKPWTCWVANS
jgi:hypothetical protein